MKDMPHTTYSLRSTSGAHALTRLFAATAIALAIAGCGKTESAEKVPTQVAAKVDGTEISVHQINYVMTRAKMNAETAEAAQSMRKQVLEKLVDQQLLVQKAMEDKLDRSPDVQMALETARRDVLADAYLRQATGAATPADDRTVRKYYDEHPELFSQRRVFQLQEFSYPASTPAETQAAVKSIVESGKPAEEVVKALAGSGVEVARTESQRASEQISLELLPRLSRLQPGQGVLTSNAQTMTAIYVRSFQMAPVPVEAAAPRIAQFLSNQNLSQNVTELVKNLRSKAKIDYVGDFAANDAASPK